MSVSIRTFHFNNLLLFDGFCNFKIVWRTECFLHAVCIQAVLNKLCVDGHTVTDRSQLNRIQFVSKLMIFKGNSTTRHSFLLFKMRNWWNDNDAWPIVHFYIIYVFKISYATIKFVTNHRNSLSFFFSYCYF